MIWPLGFERLTITAVAVALFSLGYQKFNLGRIENIRGCIYKNPTEGVKIQAHVDNIYECK